MNCAVPIWLVSVRPDDSDRAMPKSVNCSTKDGQRAMQTKSADGRTGLLGGGGASIGVLVVGWQARCSAQRGRFSAQCSARRGSRTTRTHQDIPVVAVQQHVLRLDIACG